MVSRSGHGLPAKSMLVSSTNTAASSAISSPGNPSSPAVDLSAATALTKPPLHASSLLVHVLLESRFSIRPFCSLRTFLCHQEQKKPTCSNTRRRSNTSAYSSTNPPAAPSCSLSSRPTTSNLHSGGATFNLTAPPPNTSVYGADRERQGHRDNCAVKSTSVGLGFRRGAGGFAASDQDHRRRPPLAGRASPERPSAWAAAIRAAKPR